MNEKVLKVNRKNEVANDQALLEAFPDVDPGFVPFGSRLIVQVRSPKAKSGLVVLADETKEAELWNTQIAKVRAVGPVAFKNRTTLKDWPEGDWCEPGDFVRIPKYNQDKWIVEVEVPDTTTKQQVLFMMVNDVDILAKKIGNPLEVKAYI